jgi:hypothetical protein
MAKNNGENRIKGILEGMGKGPNLGDLLGALTGGMLGGNNPLEFFGMAEDIAKQVHTEHLELLEMTLEKALEITGPMEPEEFKEKYVLAKKIVHKDLFGKGVVTMTALAEKDTQKVLKVWKSSVKLSMKSGEEGMEFTTECELGELDDEVLEKFNVKAKGAE